MRTSCRRFTGGIYLLLLCFVFFACEKSDPTVDIEQSSNPEQQDVLPIDSMRNLLSLAQEHYKNAQLDSVLSLCQIIENQPFASLNSPAKEVYLQALVHQIENIHLLRRSLDSAKVHIDAMSHYAQRLSENQYHWKAKIHILQATYFNYFKSGDSVLFHLDKALKIQDSAQVDDPKLTIETYIQYNQHYLTPNNYGTALDYGEKALKLSLADSTLSPVLIGKCYFAKADALLGLEQYEEALAEIEKAKIIFQDLYTDRHPMIGFCYMKMANIYSYKRDFEKIHLPAQTALGIFEETLNENRYVFGLLSFKTAYGYALQANHDHFKSNKLLDKAMLHYNESEGNIDNEISSVYNNYMTNSNAFEDHSSKLKYAKLVLELRQRIFESPSLDIARAYGNMGFTYRTLGDLEKAIEYINKALREYDELFEDENNDDYAIIYSNLGRVYRLLGKYEEASKMYNKALEIDRSLYGSQHLYLAHDYLNIATLYRDLEKYDSSEIVIDKVIEICNALPPSNANDNMLSYAYDQYVSIYIAKEDYEKAIEANTKATNLREKDGKKSINLWIERANLYYLSEDIEEAKKIVMQTKSMFVPERYDIFALDTSSMPSNQKQNISYIITILGNIYKYEAEQQNNDTLLLQESLKHYKASIDIRKDIFKKQRDPIRRKDILESNTSYYEPALNIAFKLYNITKDKSYFERAFHLTETDKAAVLNEKIRKNEASTFTNVPSALLEQEKELDVEIAYYNKLKFDETRSSSPDTQLIHSYEEKLFNVNRSKDSLIAVLEQNYPKYYKIQYDDSTIDLSTLQADLKEQNAGLIEFFYGDTTIVALGITANDLNYHKIVIDSTWREEFDSLISNINRPPDQYQREKDFLNAKEHYSKQSFKFYQKLIEPFQDQLRHTAQLVIIPDGKLSYLPFELLITKKSEGEEYRNLPYLFKEYNIQYEYAANILIKDWKDRIADNGFLGVAPLFESDGIGETRTALYSDNLRSMNGAAIGLPALPYAKAEVEEIGEITVGKTIIHDAATEENFKQEAKNYNVIHLGTHAVINDEHPNYSFFAFTATADSISEEDQFLYAYELYNMRLNADLAVLSACETGVGKFQKGEGVKSLSWAFKYAGCPNVVTSLWKADDQSTSQLMINFYQNLKQGKGKAEALQQAKLNFLASAEEKYTHPFYWGNFILIGDNEIVEFDRTNWTLLFLIAALLGMIALVYIGYRNKRISKVSKEI